MLAAGQNKKKRSQGSTARSAMQQEHCAAIGSGVRRKIFVLLFPLISLCPTSSCLRVRVPSSPCSCSLFQIRHSWLVVLCRHCLFLLRFQASLHYCPAAPGIMHDLSLPSLLYRLTRIATCNLTAPAIASTTPFSSSLPSNDKRMSATSMSAESPSSGLHLTIARPQTAVRLCRRRPGENIAMRCHRVATCRHRIVAAS
mgnify:CR=1 FL=1